MLVSGWSPGAGVGRAAHAVKQFKHQPGDQIRSETGRGAPQGLALGGGCEVSLHAARIQAAAEAYIGLVEAGVGLIPGAAAPGNMIRANEHAAGGEDLDLFHALKPVFEAIAMAKGWHERGGMPRLGILAPGRWRFHESRSPGCG